MTAPVVPDFVLNLFKNEIKKINLIIIENLCKIYKIDIDDAKLKLEDSLNMNFELNKNDKLQFTTKQKELPVEDRCIARLFYKKQLEVTQCSRRKKNCEFCKKHDKMNIEGRLKYGTINEEKPAEISETQLLKLKKKSIL
jgi:hypothetical protein